jgi:hypothetical protein
VNEYVVVPTRVQDLPVFRHRINFASCSINDDSQNQTINSKTNIIEKNEPIKVSTEYKINLSIALRFSLDVIFLIIIHST